MKKTKSVTKYGNNIYKVILIIDTEKYIYNKNFLINKGNSIFFKTTVIVINEYSVNIIQLCLFRSSI